jgi:hypothetical protein
VKSTITHGHQMQCKGMFEVMLPEVQIKIKVVAPKKVIEKRS